MMEILMTHRDEYRVVPVSVKCYDLTYWGLLQFVRVHNHDSLEILVMREGTMDVHLGEAVIRLMPGDAVIVNPYVTHAIDFVLDEGDRVVYNCLMLELPRFALNYASSRFDELLHELCVCNQRYQPFWAGSESVTAELRLIVDRLKTLFEGACADGSVLHESALVSEAYRLLTLLSAKVEDTPPEFVSSLDLTFINSVTDYVEANYAQPITSMDVCTALCISRRNFTRLFRRSFGTTFTDYLREYRISRAATDFRGSKLPVYEVAAAVGFPDYCSFSRTFKRIIGVSPSQYFKR
ncbi:MAG: helix-turn-helix transcriptional regulator [Clostridia bacterium]|nr:helix-turn-helix transcriptional regulator [Clostridia bacterium]